MNSYFCIADFNVIVSPKQKIYRWTANIDQVNPKDFKNYVRELYKPPMLENDRAILNFMSDRDRYFSRKHVSFRKMLQLLVSKKSFKFTMFIETI